MKIAELASFVMHFEANIAENYPTVYSSDGAIEALKVIDQLTERLGEDALDKDFQPIQIVEELDMFYIIGSAPAIDVWIEEHDREYGKVYS